MVLWSVLEAHNPLWSLSRAFKIPEKEEPLPVLWKCFVPFIYLKYLYPAFPVLKTDAQGGFYKTLEA